MSDDASTKQDVKRRIGCACEVMQNLSPVWKSKVINKETKTRVYETLVLSVLLYNSETWTLKESTKKKLLVFEMGCLRRIKGPYQECGHQRRTEDRDRCNTKNSKGMAIVPW